MIPALSDFFTPWELRGSFYAADYIAWYNAAAYGGIPWN